MNGDSNIEKKEIEISESVIESHVTETKDISDKSLEELILELEELCNSTNPYSISKNVEEIKTLFYKKIKSENVTKEPSDENKLEQKDKLHPSEIKFKKIHNKFKKLKSNYRREREKIEENNLVIKQNIINALGSISVL